MSALLGSRHSDYKKIKKTKVGKRPEAVVFRSSRLNDAIEFPILQASLPLSMMSVFETSVSFFCRAQQQARGQ